LFDFALIQSKKFYSTFSPKTLNTLRKHAVMKTMLSFAAGFWQQRSVVLRFFSEKGELFKISNIWANLKKIIANVSYIVLCIY
jgi:hypothetical protein